MSYTDRPRVMRQMADMMRLLQPMPKQLNSAVIMLMRGSIRAVYTTSFISIRKQNAAQKRRWSLLLAGKSTSNKYSRTANRRSRALALQRY
jgi:hypothetical protein